VLGLSVHSEGRHSSGEEAAARYVELALPNGDLVEVFDENLDERDLFRAPVARRCPPEDDALLMEAARRLRTLHGTREGLLDRVAQVERLEAEIASLRGGLPEGVAEVPRWRQGEGRREGA
jgi:hypothetical protein